MHDQNNIQRLGFTAWADNLIVNAIEDLGDKRPYDYDVESEDVTIVLRQIGDEITATVRAYVPGLGWHYHDRVIKKKGGSL
jgi:uncharacterized metal-binding protein